MRNVLIALLFLIFSFSIFASIPKNFGTVIPDVYRGGRITHELEYKYLSDLGINTIISLEFFHEENETYCNKYNFDCQRYSIFQLPFKDIDMEKLKKSFKAVVNALNENKKIYIHCYRGSDRTGALSSALIIREKTCDKEYDSSLLLIEIKNTLNKYNFSEFLFPELYSRILSWVRNPPKWICNS